MIFLIFSVWFLIARVVFGRTAAQLCRGTAERADDGNWYCSEVTAITYKNISQPGEYNRTTRVNPDTGLCDHEPVAYSGVGPFTPLIGELSMHLRGPMNVSQLAVYKLSGMSISKRDSSRRRKGSSNRKRKKHRPRDGHGTIRSVWHSFWHHTHDNPNTEGEYTTEQADSTATTGQTAVSITKSKSTATTAQAPHASSAQFVVPTDLQTSFSTVKQSVATTPVQIAHSTIGQVDSTCTTTPTITTTIFVQGSTCPNSIPGITQTQTQTQILSLPPIVPLPMPVPIPASAPPMQAPPNVSLPPPAASVPPAVLPPLVSTATVTTTATTTFEVTDTECPESSSFSSLTPTRLPAPVIEPENTECPCEGLTAVPSTASLLSPPPSSQAAIPPPPPAPPAPPAHASPLLPASSLPCLDNAANASATNSLPLLRRDDQDRFKTAVSLSAGSTSSGPAIKVAAASSWSRVAYYTSAAPAAATGFAFLANLGDPQQSGTFDYAFGNSLGYVIGDGSKVAADSTPFGGNLETSEREIAVFTDKLCDGNCEYARPDATAHYGWDGPSKAFFIEFQMDHYDNHGSDQGMLSDAPAWWFLNAAIPRILQYGNDRNNIPCSCWSTGCGEFDAFEILGHGEMRAKSTIHRQGNLEGGDTNYFLRPVGRTIKFVVVYHNWNITARVLDDEFAFGDSLTQAQIDEIVAYDANDDSHSLFPVGD